MIYNVEDDLFMFEKNDIFLEILKEKIQNGVIKKYPEFYLLEPLPEILHYRDYDHVIIDGKEIQWDDILKYTKDRVKAVVGEKTPTTEKHVRIEKFYSKKYDSDEIEKIFKEFDESEYWYNGFDFSKKIMGYDLIQLRVR